MGAKVTVGIGQVCEGIQELVSSYQSAREAVSYRVLYGSNRAINMTEVTGTTASANYVLQTAALGNIDVKSYGFLTGFSTPFAFDAGAGVTKMMVGSEIGNIFLYDQIDNNLSGNFNRVDTTLFKINEGTRCSFFCDDITGALRFADS